MFFRQLNARLFQCGVIALVLLASLPEVFCCCDISWGPGGLFGSAALCKLAAPAPDCSCCCDTAECPQVTDVPQSAEGNLCQDQKCQCRFSLVNPAPMVSSPSMECEHPTTMAVWDVATIVPACSAK